MTLERERERMRNRAYRGQREDGWKAEDKLSFRQRSRMCVGGKTHFVVRGQWTRGVTGRREGGKHRDGLQEIAWEEEGKTTG